MIRPLSPLVVLFVAATCSFSGTNKENEAEFFAGVTLLQQTDLKPDEKAEKFRELAVLTGISAAEAKTVLERYRERPEEWRKIDSIMMKFLNDANSGFRKKDSLRTAAKDSCKKADSTRKTPNAKNTTAAFRGNGSKNMAKPLTASKTKR